MRALEEVAGEARAAVEQWSSSGGGRLSAGKCAVASSYLVTLLREAGYKPVLVQGVFRCDSRDPDAPSFLGSLLTPVHHWVLVGDVLVDVTADQFNNRLEADRFAPVVIERAGSLDRHIAQAEVEPFTPEDGDWRAAFVRPALRWHEDPV